MTMLYYLDTNGLYNIRKIDPNKIKSCITSVMAIIELLTGVKESTFNRRKAVLKMVYASRITIDYAFPEEIIFNSFDYFNEYEFVEGREQGVLQLVSAIIKAGAYEDYVNQRHTIQKWVMSILKN